VDHAVLRDGSDSSAAASLEEQIEIARRLDTLDELALLASRYAKLVSEQVQSVSAELINRGITQER
jgi:hypothetical protein